MTAPTETEVRDALESPSFSHCRAGDQLYRGLVLVYHRDDKSPSGVTLALAAEASVVDPMLRAIRQTSPLSPTER